MEKGKGGELPMVSGRTEERAIVHHRHSIGREERARLKGQKPCILWFTGLSGSGKSTIANALERELHRRGVHTYLLDGDNLRLGLNRDLGFSVEDRAENIRRVGEVARLFVDSGTIVLAALISPLREERERIRERMGKGEFVEIHVDTPLEVCESRDPKGLYARARAGEIPSFTGISSPYEAPTDPEIRLHGDRMTVEASVRKILDYLERHDYIAKKEEEG